MEKKGYIKDGLITDAGDAILNIYVKENVIGETVEKVNVPAWAESMHGKCEEVISKLTGSKQIRSVLGGKSYAFLCNKVDLTKRIIKTVTLYKIKDLELMEKTILNYINTSVKKRSYFPTIEYYIFKENKSLLITDMQDIPEDQDKSEFDVIDTNALFNGGK